MSFLLTEPPSPPASIRPDWDGVDLEWIGRDGSRWGLSDGAEGVWLERHPDVGVHDPDFVVHDSESRVFHGKRLRSWRSPARDLFWPVIIYQSSSDGWDDTYKRFFRSFHPFKEGVFRAGFKGVWRELRCTLAVSDQRSDIDPRLLGHGQFDVSLSASQPFWTGAPVSRGPWQAPVAVPFFGDGAPPFHISKSANFGSAAIENPGDVPAFPVWTVTGSLSGVVLGVGGLIIDVPFTVGAGEVLRIDTDPRHVTALLNGVDVSAALGFQAFAPVEPGGVVPLTVAGAGDGSVSCELTPLFFRAF